MKNKKKTKKTASVDKFKAMNELLLEYTNKVIPNILN